MSALLNQDGRVRTAMDRLAIEPLSVFGLPPNDLVHLAWGKHAITVNAVVPAVETPGAERLRAFLGPQPAAAMTEQTAQRLSVASSLGSGQLGDPVRDLGPVLVFLASEGSRFITGQLLSVSGGLLMLGA